ncbi:hypothetical protein [Bartonella ancashensis]|uniref:Lipoprotein n=1 Tax=Bartonella ancashensis TaxID=1318743 RepID=A0A0M4LFZ1_9HYPH|nr:hypothetical protein [Bartonella ancashensis]ALE03219.1 hypothetical protein PU02_0405 [Bartonella ancashensis]
MKIIAKVLVISLLGSVILIGCGRKGTMEEFSLDTAKSSQGTLISKDKEDKPFILDGLIQ